MEAANYYFRVIVYYIKKIYAELSKNSSNSDDFGALSITDVVPLSVTLLGSCQNSRS